MTTLKQARDEGKLDEFIKEREAETGDADALDKTVSSMAGKSSEAPQASPRRNRGG